jgi:hypothetical protein
MSNDVFDENKYNILSDCCMLDFIMRQLTIIIFKLFLDFFIIFHSCFVIFFIPSLSCLECLQRGVNYVIF